MTQETTQTVSEDGQHTPTEPKALAPISTSNRIDTMDILRGFALVGIALMNVEWFNRTITMIGQFDNSLTGADWGAGWFIRLFVEGKFYKLFSVLFGMGFAVMLIRAQEAGRPFYAWFSRRMIFLFMFGMAHLVFLWRGDILHDYAAGGLVLLFWIWLINAVKKFAFLQESKWFLRISLGVMAMPFVIGLGFALAYGPVRYESTMLADNQERQAMLQRADEIKQDPVLSQQLIDQYLARKEADEPRPEVDTDAMTLAERIEHRAQRRFENQYREQELRQEEEQAFTGESWVAATKYRAKESLKSLEETPIFAFLISFPLFMIGYWFIASGVMRRPQDHVGKFKAMMWVGLGIGIPLSAGSLLMFVNPAFEYASEVGYVSNTFFMLGQYIMCAGYIGALVLMCMTVRGKKWLGWLAPMGRMALTNYIMHSIIFSSIFYGYAGGMFGEIPRMQQVGLVALVILAQAIMSRMWLQHFKFGPLEWIWRSLTYLKLQPMRVDKSEAAEQGKPAHV